MKRLIWLGCVLAVAATSRHASAQIIQVTIENLQPADGFTFSPVWLGFHDGGFDLFDAGVAVNGDIEAVAELGNSGPLSTTFNATPNGDATSRYDTLATAPGGFPGAPVFEPGESVSFALNVPNAGSNRFLSLGAMVVPSNDFFVGNANPTAWQVFNPDGSFAGPLTFDINAEGVWDAGTEVNSTTDGAAFIVGSDATMGTTENGVATAFPGFDSSLFVGVNTPPGPVIGSGLSAGEGVVRITISAVPEPSSLALAAGAVVALAAARRRMRA